MAFTNIEWTEKSWNPLTGCTKISLGCKNCYAEKMAKRLQAMGSSNYKNGFTLSLHESALMIPYTWKKPRLIFVNSMSDLFHEDVPISFIEKVFNVMNANQHHTFQVLTKRSKKLREIAPLLKWTKNIWVGVTIESIEYIDRLEDLKSIPSPIRFLSCEPLLSSLGKLDLEGIQWVIAGGESGSGARRIEKDWIIEIRDNCIAQNVPFFFKQWGGKNKKKTGKLLDGKVWQEMPHNK